jgi:hypothetical protein
LRRLTISFEFRQDGLLKMASAIPRFGFPFEMMQGGSAYLTGT